MPPTCGPNDRATPAQVVSLGREKPGAGTGFAATTEGTRRVPPVFDPDERSPARRALFTAAVRDRSRTEL
jgi:hypothetical protein